jgi:hypothetical protein
MIQDDAGLSDTREARCVELPELRGPRFDLLLERCPVRGYGDQRARPVDSARHWVRRLGNG